MANCCRRYIKHYLQKWQWNTSKIDTSYQISSMMLSELVMLVMLLLVIMIWAVTAIVNQIAMAVVTTLSLLILSSLFSRYELQRTYIQFRIIYTYLVSIYKQYLFSLISCKERKYYILYCVLQSLHYVLGFLFSYFKKGIIFGEFLEYLVEIFEQERTRKAIIMAILAIFYFLFYLLFRALFYVFGLIRSSFEILVCFLYWVYQYSLIQIHHVKVLHIRLFLFNNVLLLFYRILHIVLRQILSQLFTFCFFIFRMCYTIVMFFINFVLTVCLPTFCFSCVYYAWSTVPRSWTVLICVFAVSAILFFIYSHTLIKYSHRSDAWIFTIPQIVEDSFLKQEDRESVWQFSQYVRINKETLPISLMGDTGATICIVNDAYARKNFQSSIRSLKTPLKAKTANNQTLPLRDYIDVTVLDNKTKRTIATYEFYLVPHFEFEFLASIYMINKLFKHVRKDFSFDHPPEPDEHFGTCDNWNEDMVRVNYDDNHDYRIDTTNQVETPYHKYLRLCTTPQPVETKLRSVSAIRTDKKSERKSVKFNRIYHISNFHASKDEIEQAKKLAHNRTFGDIPLEHIKKRSIKLYEKMKHLCYVQFKHVWAKHQFHITTLKNREFKIDLRDDAKGMKIFKPQYHLDQEKRLIVLYHSMENIKNGLFAPDHHSIHNVPIIVVTKKDGRMRPAYDLTKLNTYTKDVQSHIPSYNWLFELLRGRGLISTTDAKNFFENIPIRASDRELCAVTTPLGRYHLTHASYGFKNIATYAQEISNDVVAPFRRAASFVDDMFIHHAADATDDELYNEAKLFLQRVSDIGLLLHPEKTYFFVEEIDFIGYRFTQKGTMPLPKYIKKVLDVKKPTTVKEIQSYLGLIQYIARYLHKSAEWAYYLNILTHTNNMDEWKKGGPQDEAFETLQKLVKNVKLLAHPTPDDPFLVQCDASKHAIGAVLFQKQWDDKLQRRQWKIIEFYSKQVDSHLVKHPIMVKECMAIAYSLNHWKHFLLRQKFFLDTDHKNLISLYDDDESRAPKMRKKQIFITLREATSMFNFSLAHLQGSDIILADYLSRDGNYLNNIDDNPHVVDASVKLINTRRHIKIQQQQKLDHCFNLYLKHHKKQQVLNRVFLSRAIYASPQNTIYDPKLYDSEYLNNFTADHAPLAHFDAVYMHEFGYIHPVVQKMSVVQDQVDIPLYEPPDLKTVKPLKSCLKNSKKLKLSKKVKVDHKLLHQRLKQAVKNTVHNINISADNAPINDSLNTSANVYGLFNLVRLYCLKNIKRKKPKRIFLGKGDPNFHIDENNRRKSVRESKPPQYWPEPQFQTNRDVLPVEEEVLDIDAIKDEDSDDIQYNEKIFQPNQSFRTDNSFDISFPFNISAKLSEAFHSSIYTAKDYAELLSRDNLLAYQNSDPICRHIEKFVKHSNKKSEKYLRENYGNIYRLAKSDQLEWIDNIIYVKPNNNHSDYRLYIPSKMIHIILRFEHEINHFSHPGYQPMLQIFNNKYYWLHMSQDIRNFVNICELCTKAKGSKKHNVGLLKPLISHAHGQIVHFDFAGPFYGRFRILIMVDNYTGAVMLQPCYGGESAENVAHALIHRWYPIHGIPQKIVTDRGVGFESAANKIVSKHLGIHKVFTSSYHPQSNAKAERVVQEVKKALRLINVAQNNHFTDINMNDSRATSAAIKEMALILPAIQFSINQKIHSVTHVSPHMLLYGKNMRDIVDFKLAREMISQLPKEFDTKPNLGVVTQIKAMIDLAQNVKNKNHEKYVKIYKDNFDIGKFDDKFKVGDSVAYYIGDRARVLKKLHPRFTGPWKIVKRVSNNTVTIKSDEGEFSCHVSMLKPYVQHKFVPLIEFKRTLRAKKQIKTKQKAQQPLRRSKRLHDKKAKNEARLQT